ncbi:MAG TPA: LLM class flavin-dependent oxidoreductase [Pseudomonadales bacterium]
MHELRFGVSYDFRNPPDSGVSDRALYQEILEQVRWLDSLGADLVWFTEHHFVEDGYLPSWVPVAGAMAAVTERVRFGTDICLMPFNHPIRLAEDLAVLDNVSGGRVELGLGMGYAPHEFRGFGIPVRRRVSLMDEGIEVLQRCFRGERFSYRGRRFQFDDVLIKPGYVQSGGPPLWVAAMSEGGAERAARFGTHLLPQGSRRRTLGRWRDALERAGRDPAAHRVGIIRSTLVTDDRETDWPLVRAAEKYRMALYQRFFQESGEGFGDPAEVIPQTWVVGNVDHCVEELTRFVTEFGITDVVTMAVPPGLRAAQMAPSLERLFRDVVPRVKRAVSQSSE